MSRKRRSPVPLTSNHYQIVSIVIAIGHHKTNRPIQPGNDLRQWQVKIRARWRTRSPRQGRGAAARPESRRARRRPRRHRLRARRSVSASGAAALDQPHRAFQIARTLVAILERAAPEGPLLGIAAGKRDQDRQRDLAVAEIVADRSCPARSGAPKNRACRRSAGRRCRDCGRSVRALPPPPAGARRRPRRCGSPRRTAPPSWPR